jgi:hypothetical protein
VGYSLQVIEAIIPDSRSSDFVKSPEVLYGMPKNGDNGDKNDKKNAPSHMGQN